MKNFKTQKEELFYLLEINPDLTWKQCHKAIPKMVRQHYYRVKSAWLKSKGLTPKRQVIKKVTKRKAITPPTPQELIKKPPEELLMLGMTKQIDLDPTLFNLYIKMGLYQRDQQKLTQEYQYYKRATWLKPHQIELIERAKEGCIFVVGKRQFSYKTSSLLIAALELMREYDQFYINFLTTSKPLGAELIGKVDGDKWVNEVWEPYLYSALTYKKVLKNGNWIQSLPCTKASVKGRTVHILWIDEIDDFFEVKGALDVLAAAIPQILTTISQGGKVWMSCNMGEKRGFHMFMEVLQEFGDMFKVFTIQEPDGALYKEQTLVQLNPGKGMVEYTDEFANNMAYKLLEAIRDEMYAQAMIYNIPSRKMDPFSPRLIKESFESWSEDKLPEFPTNVESATDPGFTHGTGYIILAMDNEGDIWEVHANEMYGGDPRDGGYTEDMIKDYIHKHNIEYGVRAWHCESNSGGKYWMLDLKMRGGYAVWAANFGIAQPKKGTVSDEHKAYERTFHERILKDLLEKKKIHLHNKTLYNEFMKYDPYASKVDGKGDLMDALLIDVFNIVGGIQYIYDMIREDEIEQDAFAL